MLIIQRAKVHQKQVRDRLVQKNICYQLLKLDNEYLHPIIKILVAIKNPEQVGVF
jgi:hypothetical protein